MCQRCSQDAMESGLFRERPVRVRLREDLQTGAHRLIPRIIESMDMNDPDDWNALADALEDGGYTDKAILARLRRMDATAFQYLHLG